ncbi:MAG TPA: aryl-sulfate sulfotransferase [Alphaproteobacteria bacterium]|nr:aryl-sulfate sulfotransferase [Alphaproteobacteria bacterium]
MARDDDRPSAGNGADAADPARLRKHSVMIAGHRTSVSLEDAFWHVLRRIARQRGESVGRLIASIDRERTGNLSSALRVFVLEQLQMAAEPAGTTAPDAS